MSKTPYPLNRDLQYFLAVYSAGTVSAGAELLGIDQGNLSRSLKRLEKNAQFKLFHRHHKGLLPTEQAKRLADSLKAMNEIWTQVKRDQPSPRTIKFGFHTSLGRTYFPGLLVQLEQLIDEVSFQVSLSRSSEITKMVMERQLDLGVVVNVVKSKDLVIRNYSEENIELVSRADNEKNQTYLINPEMLFSGRIIQGMAFDRVIEISDYELIAEICSRDLRFTGLVPSGVRMRYPQLKVRRVEREKIKVSLVTYPGSVIAPLLKKLKVP
jgi:DNA-binding transcriptional LysR family regulator